MIPLPQQTAVKGSNPAITVTIFAGVPWDLTYNNVRLYENQEDAAAHLRARYTSFQVPNVAEIDYGSMLVEVPLAEINAVDFNYLLIEDMTRGIMKRHFAFMTGTARAGMNATTISFEEDVWQNNVYGCVFGTTFIERAHVEKQNDIAGRYTEDEGLELGEYISADKLPFTIPDMSEDDYGEWDIVIACTFDEKGQAMGGFVTQGVYNGVEYYVFDRASTANKFIQDVTAKNLIEGIVQIFMLPKKWCDGSQTNYQHITIPKIAGSIDDYAPKNQKLFTYPYVCLHMSNNSGAYVDLRQEFFNSTEMVFKACAPLSCNPKMYIFAENYKGQNLNNIDCVNFSSFPQCAVSIDSYKAWLAQTGAAQTVSAVKEVGESKGFTFSETVTDFMAGALASIAGGTGGGSFLGTITNSLRKNTQAYIQPPTSIGTQGGGSLLQVNLCGVHAWRYTIRREFVKKIDDFLSMFGYKLNQFGSPSYYMHTRKRYNYVKCKNCNILQGSVDAGAMPKLRSIFENGCTVWHVDDIGDYSLDND